MPTTATLRYKNAGIKPAFFPDLARTIPVAIVANANYPAGTMLGELIGGNAVKTLTITGGPTGGSFTITYSGVTSGSIAWNANATGVETGNGSPGTPYVTVQAAINAMSNIGVNAAQSLSVAATGGTFILSYNGFQTAPIAFNATAATVQTALQAIFGTGNVTCTGGPLNTSPVTITWSGTYSSFPLAALIVNNSQMVGGTATISVTNPGGSANVACAGTQLPGGSITLTFQNALGYQAIGSFTTTGSFTGGASPAASVANTTAGSSGTLGTFKAVSPAATDGSQTAKAILPVDISTDVNGNITYSAVVNNGGEFGQLDPVVYVYVGGYFRTQDVPGLTESMLFNDLKGHYVNGNIANGGVFRIP